MAGWLGGVIAAIVGSVLAVGAGLGLVSAAGGSTPPPVDAPYIVYGES